MPADGHAGTVLGTENLTDASGGQAAEIFHGADDRCEPARNWVSFLKLPQAVIVAEAKRGNPPFALVGAELEWLTRQRLEMGDEFGFGHRVDEVGLVAQTFGARATVCKEGKLGQSSRLSPNP